MHQVPLGGGPEGLGPAPLRYRRQAREETQFATAPPAHHVERRVRRDHHRDDRDERKRCAETVVPLAGEQDHREGTHHDPHPGAEVRKAREERRALVVGLVHEPTARSTLGAAMTWFFPAPGAPTALRNRVVVPGGQVGLDVEVGSFDIHRLSVYSALWADAACRRRPS